jgi:hypothetical protein
MIAERPRSGAAPTWSCKKVIAEFLPRGRRTVQAAQQVLHASGLRLGRQGGHCGNQGGLHTTFHVEES